MRVAVSLDRLKNPFCSNSALRLIWPYIPELLLPPKGLIRVVTGETEYEYSTESKKERYPLVKSVHGFKINIRIVVQVEEEDIDVAVG